MYADGSRAIFLESKEFYQWHEREGTLKYIKRHYHVFERILKKNLAADHDRLILVADTGYPDHRTAAILAGCYGLAATKLNLPCTFVIASTGKEWARDKESQVNAILNDKGKSIVILNVSEAFSTVKQAGMSFREIMRQKKNKWTSTTGLGGVPSRLFPEVVKAYNLDYHVLEERARRLKEQMDRAETVHIHTRKGTDLTIDIRHMQSLTNVGNYQKYSQGGNLPCGEVYIAPKEGGVNGKLVIDESLKVGTRTVHLDRPVTFYLDQGRISKVKADPKALHFLDVLLRCADKSGDYTNVKEVAEFGIGLNPHAKLLGATIINEKCLGTAHIAFGGNSWFVGHNHAHSHFDHVFSDPLIRIDGKVIQV